VDGCKGDPQVLVEIASRKEVGGLLVLVIENEKTYRLQPEKTHWNKNDSYKLPAKDSGTNNFEASRRSGRLLREVTLKTRLVSDLSLRSKFGHDKGKVRNHLIRLAEMAKPILRMLDVKVNLDIRGVRHYPSNIDTSEYWLNRIRNRFKVRDWEGITAGIAFIGSACDTRTGEQININWVQNDDFGTVLTFAHELGHNLGMEHDFDHGDHCDGKGIMSYGDHPKAWSTCSNKDFANWYNRDGYRCL